jgi:hypothetical protein
MNRQRYFPNSRIRMADRIMQSKLSMIRNSPKFSKNIDWLVDEINLEEFKMQAKERKITIHARGDYYTIRTPFGPRIYKYNRATNTLVRYP